MNKQEEKKRTLVEKALETKIGRKRSTSTVEEIDLALAWLQGLVSLKQVATALNMPRASAAYCFLATRVQAAFQLRKIQIRKEEP